MWTGRARLVLGSLVGVTAVVLAAGAVTSSGSTTPLGDLSAAHPPPTHMPAGHPRATVVQAATTVAAPPADRCAGSSARGRRIVVDLSDQQLWLCQGARLLLTSPVTTGKDRTPTPTGRWRVHGRMTDKVIQGEGYRRHVDHWMPYFQGYGFHDASWQRFDFGDDAARRARGSHGCVRVPGPVMAELFDHSPLGTAVTITA